jgi:hypothetical protein
MPPLAAVAHRALRKFVQTFVDNLATRFQSVNKFVNEHCFASRSGSRNRLRTFGKTKVELKNKINAH